MLLAISAEDYNNHSVFFCEPSANNITKEGTFVRIVYSSPIYSTNGICISILLTNAQFNPNMRFHKYECTFNTITNGTVIELLSAIETQLLTKYMSANLSNWLPAQYNPVRKISSQLKNGIIKVFADNATVSEIETIAESASDIRLVLKISGIWVLNEAFGLTYKFSLVRS